MSWEQSYLEFSGVLNLMRLLHVFYHSEIFLLGLKQKEEPKLCFCKTRFSMKLNPITNNDKKGHRLHNL